MSTSAREVHLSEMAVRNAGSTPHLEAADWHRTVFIDSLGVSTTDFGIDEEQQQALIASGRRAAEHYLRWFENAPEDAPPLNRN